MRYTIEIHGHCVRTEVPSRPINFLYGCPGAGKSTLLRKIRDTTAPSLLVADASKTELDNEQGTELQTSFVLRNMPALLWERVLVTVDGRYRIRKGESEYLPSEALSDGELRTLRLLHRIVQGEFSMVLLDNPEQHLHCTTQDAVYGWLLEAHQLTSNCFIVATQSPYIVGVHDDLMVLVGWCT